MVLKGKGFTRILTVLLTVMLALSACGAALAEEAADVLFQNGYIYTVDAEDSVAQALAVKDGRIIFVGSGAEAAAYQGAETQVVDLDGRMMMPGLIDSHMHSVMPEFFDFNLLGKTTLPDILAAVEQYVNEHPDKEAYNGFGYMTNVFEGEELEKGPRKERLDEIVSDKPLAIAAFDGHAMWANSKFFEVHGITYETASPRGGVVEKDEATGEVWGTLKDSAIALRGGNIYDQETLQRELPNFVAILNSFGYTSIMTLPAFGTMPVPFDAYRALEEAGNLDIKVHGAISVMDFRKEEDIQRMLDAAETYNSEMVKMKTAKFFMDGVVDAHTAYLLDPYDDMPDSHGMAGWDLDVLQDVYTQVNEAGIQIHTHAIGDAALRMSLDAMEYAQTQAPGDHRNAVTHLQVVDEADIPRLGQLGVVAVVQPFWHYRQPMYWDVVEEPAIGERASREYPLKSFLDTGAVLAASSDYPVTTVPNAFEAMEIGVTRNMPLTSTDVKNYGMEPITDIDDPTYLLTPEERLSIQEMIRAYTAGGAYLLFEEDEIGTLEVGKAADLVILDQNLLEIDPLDIASTKVLQTYVNGALVYSADEK